MATPLNEHEYEELEERTEDWNPVFRARVLAAVRAYAAVASTPHESLADVLAERDRLVAALRYAHDGAHNIAVERRVALHGYPEDGGCAPWSLTTDACSQRGGAE